MTSQLSQYQNGQYQNASILDFIGTKDEDGGECDGDNCSYKMYKTSLSYIVTTRELTPSFLQA